MLSGMSPGGSENAAVNQIPCVGIRNRGNTNSEKFVSQETSIPNASMMRRVGIGVYTLAIALAVIVVVVFAGVVLVVVVVVRVAH